MRTTEKFKDVSARVLLTPMPSDGVDQFTFMRPSGDIRPEQVEALLQFNENLNPLDLLRAITKLLSAYVVNNEKYFTPEDMLAVETIMSFTLDCWEVERGTFEPLHKNFAIKQE